MSLLYDDRPVPHYVRTRIGMPLPRIEFGASDPLDEPGGYRYEISPTDRRVFEQAVADTKAGDYERSRLARDALLGALRASTPLGPILALGGEQLFNLLGFGIRAEIIIGPGGSGAWSSEHPSGLLARGDLAMAVMLTSCSWKVYELNGARYAKLNLSTTRSFKSWSRGTIDSTSWQCASYDAANLAVSNGPLNNNDPYLGNIQAEVRHGESLLKFTEPKGNEGLPVTKSLFWDHTGLFHDGVKSSTTPLSVSSSGMNSMWRLTAHNFYYLAPDGRIDKSVPFLVKELPTGLGASYDFESDLSLEDIGLDPSTFDPFLSDLTPEEMHDLIGNLKETPWYDKYPPTDQPVVEPSPTPHPSNPGWPCAPSGPGAEVPGVVVAPPGFRVPRPPGFDGPKPGDEMCVIIGGKKKCGKIRRVPKPGEDMIIEEPPYRDERFTKPWCPKKGTLIITLVKQLATELGFDPGESGWVVDTDCKKRWPGGCFSKGSSKFDAMWKLADMCGSTFNPDAPHIGTIKPLPPDPRTYGPYHELRDLFVFEAVQDDLDIPSHVEVYVPHFRSRRGYSVVIAVNTPYGLKDKWLRIRAPKGMSEADAMDWAAKKAREFEIVSQLTDYAIPYNESVAYRHQMMLRIPSEGYDGRFMVWEFSHEIDIEEGAVTKVRGVELSRTRYAPRFEGYQEAWVNAPSGYGVMS